MQLFVIRKNILAAADLDLRYSKYAKLRHVHYLCTISLRTPYARESSLGFIHAYVGLLIRKLLLLVFFENLVIEIRLIIALLLYA